MNRIHIQNETSKGEVVTSTNDTIVFFIFNVTVKGTSSPDPKHCPTFMNGCMIGVKSKDGRGVVEGPAM